uniref:Uncharacterized protein n=1 Tax=Arion vulgaris TaxID=1028688 RepID=A0A0B6Z7U3_9EUPU
MIFTTMNKHHNFFPSLFLEFKPQQNLDIFINLKYLNEQEKKGYIKMNKAIKKNNVMDNR